MSPRPAATSEAQRAGTIGDGHVAVIRDFCHRLPDFVDVETRQKAEAQLARLGHEHRPDELAKLADKLTDCLNPDGASCRQRHPQFCSAEPRRAQRRPAGAAGIR